MTDAERIKELEAKLAEALRERIEALDKAAHRERQLSEAWRRLAEAESSEQALRGALGKKIADWIQNADAEFYESPPTHHVVAAAWQFCADDLRAALAAGKETP